MSSMNLDRPTITMRWVKLDDNNFGVELLVSGLKDEAQAHAAMAHMERLFCAAPISEN